MSKIIPEITLGDYLEAFLNESSVSCFEKCSIDLTTENFNKNEKECLEGCYQKYFVSFSNVVNVLDLK